MRCEHCGGDLVEVDNPMRREVRHRRGVVCSGGLPALETPRPPAVEPVEPPAGPETGTGGLNRHRDAQAGESTIHITAEDMACGPLTIETDHVLSFAPEPTYPPATIPHETMPHLAAFINALKTAHYREAAASLRVIADHMPDTASAAELRPGIEYAATLLGHTADDPTEGATS
jgi:hypothetical protein